MNEGRCDGGTGRRQGLRAHCERTRFAARCASRLYVGSPRPSIARSREIGEFLIDCMWFYQQEKGAREVMQGRDASTMTCTWCAVVKSGSGVLYECEAFSLIGPVAAECPSSPLTLVPRAHVAVLTDLDPAAMAAVLAGLTRIKEAVGPADALHLFAHLDAKAAHVHVHPTVSTLQVVGKAAKPVGRPDRSRLIETMVAALRGWP